MPAQITIRNVPDEVPKELKERATLRGQSMQEYLRQDLERIASRPSATYCWNGYGRAKGWLGTSVSVESILEAKYADRA